MRALSFLNIVILYLTSVSLAQITNPVRFDSQSTYANITKSSIKKTVDGDLLFFWHDPNFNTIYFSRSTDQGLSWQEKTGIINNISYPDTITRNKIDVLTTSDGKILLAYKRHGHYLKSSTNNGYSWSDSVSLPTRPNVIQRLNVNNLKLNNLSDGTIAAVYNFRSKGVFTIYSNDALNWSTYQTIDTSGMYGSMIGLNNNQELLVYSDSISGYWNLVFRISTNAGATWSEKQILLSGSNNDFDPRIVKDSTGKILIYFKRDIQTLFPQFKQSEIFFISSIDNGINWTEPERFTNYAGQDFNHSVTLINNLPYISFISSRSFQIGKQNNQIYIGTEPDISTPPYLHYFLHEPQVVQPNEALTIKAYADDDSAIDSVKVIVVKNVFNVDTLLMFDDGLHNDSLPGDNIYGIVLNDFYPGDAIQYDFLVYDDELNIAGFNGGTFFIGLSEFTENYLFEINRFKLPINNEGIIGDIASVNINNGKFDEGVVLFSAGFYLSGKNGNTFWGNGIFSAQRLLDYRPGVVGSIPIDPKNQLYIVKTSDPHFGESWQNYRYAVQLGADFFDGDGDGIYNPIDLNGNGVWDLNEDRPDILGDVTAWCVYNDNVPKELRRYNQIDPLGIEVHQTTFAWGENLTGDINNIIYFRYRIHNRGTVSAVLDSVYFGVVTDPDIGNYQTDLVGVDTSLNSAFSYKTVSDTTFGNNAPAFSTSIMQGPYSYIPGETFIDNNGNGYFEPGIDIPIDTAYQFNGLFLGTDIFPGARNLDVSAFVHFNSADPLIGDPNNPFELRNYLLGKSRLGETLDPCTFYNGEVRGGVNCNEVNPFFWYSGNPVEDVGWINTTPTDQRMLMSAGPFSLEIDKPVDIIVAYLAGRGNTSLNSVTEVRRVANYSHNFYGSNFTQLPSEVDEKIIIPGKFELFQNYPNPFNPSTMIRYQIPEAGLVSIKIFDILGKEVKTLVNEFKSAGRYEVEFNGSNYASGVYFYQIKALPIGRQAGDYFDTKKMILIK